MTAFGGVFEHSTNSSVDRRIELNFVRDLERQSLTSAGEPAETDIWQNIDMPRSESNATVNFLRIQLALLTHIETKEAP